MLEQLSLLRQIETTGRKALLSLASEGFLPGYNFPALPRAGPGCRGEGEFIARPTNNFLYHEGAKAPPASENRTLLGWW